MRRTLLITTVILAGLRSAASIAGTVAASAWASGITPGLPLIIVTGDWDGR